MKVKIFLLAFAAISCSSADEIKPGDRVSLVRDCPLSFKEEVVSRGKRGEDFEVVAIKSGRVYLKARDGSGKPIALNAPADAVTSGFVSESPALRAGRAPFQDKIENAFVFFGDVFQNGHPQKGKFETSDEFAKRTAALPTIDGIHFLPLSYETSSRYDADREIITVLGGRFEDDQFDDFKSSFRSLLISVNDKAAGGYEAENGFGAKTDVAKESLCSFFLFPQNVESVIDFGTKDKKNQLALSFHMQRDEAKLIADKLRLVVGIRINNQVRSASEEGRVQPTFTSPVDVSWKRLGVECVVCRIVVLNPEGLEELARIDFAN